MIDLTDGIGSVASDALESLRYAKGAEQSANGPQNVREPHQTVNNVQLFKSDVSAVQEHFSAVFNGSQNPQIEFRFNV